MRRGFSRALAALCLWAAGCAVTGTGPEDAIRDRLARAGREGVTVPCGADRLALTFSTSEDVIDVRGTRARVLFRAEGQGRTEAGVHVGYIGGEAATFRLGPHGWEPDGSLLPRLAGVLDALARRRGEDAARRIVVAGPAMRGALPASPSPASGVSAARGGQASPVRAWLVRIEGDSAEVSEVAGEEGATATVRLDLQRQGESWRFPSGSL